MSTSDQDPTTGFTERVRPALPVDETTIAPMGSLPDVTMLTRLAEFGMPLPSMPAIPSAGTVPIAPNASQLSTGVPELAPFTMGPAAAVSLPAAFSPSTTAPVPQNDPRSAGAGLPVSPFALPMPEFGAPFPSFETGVPVLPPLPPLRTED